MTRGTPRYDLFHLEGDGRLTSNQGIGDYTRALPQQLSRRFVTVEGLNGNSFKGPSRQLDQRGIRHHAFVPECSVAVWPMGKR